MTTEAITMTGERADLLDALRKHRHFLRFPARGLTDEQANLRTTASALTIGGLIKHVAATEEGWAAFAVGGAEAMGGDWQDVDWENVDLENADFDPDGSWADQFRLVEGESLAGVLERYDEVARRTDELVETLPDLNVSHPLPKAPWFEADASWSIRRVLLHIIAETAQHAGHADIIRESLDGEKSMG